MSINYIYVFEKHGMLAPSSGAMDNEVWIDVGNALEMGLFDHHQGNEGVSAFSTIFDHQEFLENLKKSAAQGRDIIVHMHEAPDIDCIASLWLVRQFLELDKEEYNAFISSDVAKKLLHFVNDIDEGKGKDTYKPTLYAIFSNIGESTKYKNENINPLVVNKGLELISLAVDLLKSDPLTELYSYDFSVEFSDTFAEEIALISDAEYRREKDNEKIDFCNVEVWTKDNQLEVIRSAIWLEASNCCNGYNFARNEGYILTVFPRSVRDDDGSFTSVMVSIDPGKDIEEKYTLKPIAEIIEQMEQIEEAYLFTGSGKYRRDYSKSRTDNGHCSQKPFAVTSNPWFVAENESFFDAPYGGSLLRYEDIVELIKNNGSTVKKSFGISYKWKNTKSVVKADYVRNYVPLSSFQKEVKSWTDPDNSQGRVGEKSYVPGEGMRIVFAEVDSSLIKHNNEMLKAVCMNIAGGTYHECSDDQFLFLDYRTVLYADQSFVIILAATSKKKDENSLDESTYNLLSISDYINTANEKEFLNSPLIRQIIELFDFRNKMVETSKDTGNIKLSDRKAIESLNSKMLQLSLEHQKISIKESYIEKSVFNFLNEKYELENIRSSVMNETAVLVNEARDKMVSKFNTLSAFAVPFILIATVFQMGIIKFEELVNVTGFAANVGWGGVIILIAILIFLLGKNSKK